MTPGRLLLVGTPLGNLGDFPPRAVEALKSADLILCEDTRHSQKLLTHFGIQRPLESLHEHNEDERAEGIIKRIYEGATIAMISDAGMPVLSDPGFPVVRLAREREITVEVIPGPFAAALAVAASGIAPIPFTFVGFTPHRRGERLDFYRRFAPAAITIVAYESPERLIESLEDALTVFGNADAAVARELTKMHEEIARGSLTELLHEFTERDSVRGEITLVIGPAKELAAEASPEEVRAEFERLRGTGMRRNDAVKAVAEKFGMRKNDVYRLLLE